MSVAIIFHPDCLLHVASIGHPEQPDRVRVIQQALMRFLPEVEMTLHEAPLATRAQLLPAHDAEYLDWLAQNAPKEGVLMIDEDTLMNPYTYLAAKRAAGALCLAVDLVMQGEQAAFCNVRPPGHHAERNKAMGFCFFNNVAVGAYHAMNQHGCSRVAIVDFDVHHGNGTQDIFEEDERVLYCSSFEHPFYPGYRPENDNAHILNVPLAAGSNGAVFREAVAAAWFSALADFKPELIFFSAGFDAHTRDPLADLRLTQADYVWITKEVAKIAKACNAKMISALEGGYNLEVLASCVPAHVKAMVS